MAKIDKSIPDWQVIEGLQTGGRQRQRLERTLYDRYAYFITRANSKHQLRFEECASAYSDAILAFIHQLTSGLFDGRSSLKTYLYRLFSNKCVDSVREKQKARNQVHQTLSLEDVLLDLPDPERSAVEQLSAHYDTQVLHQQLSQLGAKKRDLLLAWGEGYSDAEIAQQFGYQSAAVVKTIRLRCLRQIQVIMHREVVGCIPNR